MSIVWIALPAALVFAAAAVVAFRWAVRNGQLDDLETPRWRPLIDDDPPAPNAR